MAAERPTIDNGYVTSIATQALLGNYSFLNAVLQLDHDAGRLGTLLRHTIESSGLPLTLHILRSPSFSSLTQTTRHNIASRLLVAERDIIVSEGRSYRAPEGSHGERLIDLVRESAEIRERHNDVFTRSYALSDSHSDSETTLTDSDAPDPKRGRYEHPTEEKTTTERRPPSL